MMRRKVVRFERAMLHFEVQPVRSLLVAETKRMLLNVERNAILIHGKQVGGKRAPESMVDDDVEDDATMPTEQADEVVATDSSDESSDSDASACSTWSSGVE